MSQVTQEQVLEVLKQIEDPDLRVDIVQLQNTLVKVQASQSTSQTNLQGGQADVLDQMST